MHEMDVGSSTIKFLKSEPGLLPVMEAIVEYYYFL